MSLRRKHSVGIKTFYTSTLQCLMLNDITVIEIVQLNRINIIPAPEPILTSSGARLYIFWKDIVNNKYKCHG